MKRYNISTIYGAYGNLTQHNDGSCNMILYWGCGCTEKPHRKKYKSIKGAKTALTRLCDFYTLTECKQV